MSRPIRRWTTGARTWRAYGLALVVAGWPGHVLAQSPATGQEQLAPPGNVAAVNPVFSEPRIIGRAIDVATRTIGDGSDEKNGLYVETSNMPSGAGWISAGPGYRHWFFGDQAIVDVSAAVSWRTYKMAQARVELPQLLRSRLAVGSQVRWQDLTQVSFFGEGPDSLESQRSEYRLESTNIAGYATVRPAQWLAVEARLGWLDRPTLQTPTGSFKRGNPATQELFSNDIVFSRAEQPTFVYGETSITADTRDRRSHPTRGGVYRAAWTHYSDRDNGGFSFERGEAEAAHFLPVLSRRLVLALHGWFVASGTDADAVVPFYVEPSLGGHNTIRGASDYRFHDRNLLVLNVETRLALVTHVDLALFADAGNVAARVSDLDLDKRAYGVGVRMHSRKSTFARLDVAHGAEGWNFILRLSDPLHVSRLARRTAAIPFVP